MLGRPSSLFAAFLGAAVSVLGHGQTNIPDSNGSIALPAVPRIVTGGWRAAVESGVIRGSRRWWRQRVAVPVDRCGAAVVACAKPRDDAVNVVYIDDPVPDVAGVRRIEEVPERLWIAQAAARLTPYVSLQLTLVGTAVTVAVQERVDWCDVAVYVQPCGMCAHTYATARCPRPARQ